MERVAIDQDRVLGTFLAGAVGDALGAPVEFATMDEIRAQFGPTGITDFELAYGGRGRITDDTQMTLFTLEAMIRGCVARRMFLMKMNPADVLQHAYQRWYHTQGVPWHDAGGEYSVLAEHPDGWLIGNEGLFRRRAPGATVMSALKAFADGGSRGSLTHAVNRSKGCGAVMRAAPAALWIEEPQQAFIMGALSASITHGHPVALQSAGSLALIVHQLWAGESLLDALEAVPAELVNWSDHHQTLDAVNKAVDLASTGRPTPEAIAEEIGGGWVAEEALAIAIWAALSAENLRDGLLLAVNHSGDTDSTGSICGNILGALHGVPAIPEHWLEQLELRDVIERLALDAVHEFDLDNPPPLAQSQERYPAW